MINKDELSFKTYINSISPDIYIIMCWLMKYKKYNISFIDNSEELKEYNAKYKFKIYKDYKTSNKTKTITLFHGSVIHNFHSILKNGLIESNSYLLREILNNYSNTLYGDGIYLTNSIKYASKYTKNYIIKKNIDFGFGNDELNCYLIIDVPLNRIEQINENIFKCKSEDCELKYILLFPTLL